MAYNTNSTIVKLNAKISILGPEIDYNCLAPISTCDQLQDFLSTIDPHQETVYVPDKCQVFSQFITKSLPTSFYKYLTAETAVIDSTNSDVKAWLIPRKQLESAMKSLRKLD